jgi:predicted nuclease of predicted toxin-antitoxin system
VLYAIEVGPSLDDEFHASRAIAEERIVVTSDYDFGELAIRRRFEFLGVVLIAPFGSRMAETAEAIAQRIHNLADSLADRLTIIEKERVRQRALERFDEA